MYEIRIKQLNFFIKSIKNQKHLLITENYKLKNERNGININKSNEKENLTENELQIKLNKLKIENIQNIKNIEKKEKQINKLNIAIGENNANDEIFKLNLEKIIKEDSNDDEYFKLLKENKINEDIKKASNINHKKLNEIINIAKVYDEIINTKEKNIIVLEDKLNKKNGLLKILEDKVKPLYKKNNLSKGNSSNFIKKGNLNINNDKQFDINKKVYNLKNYNSQKNINDMKFKFDYDNIINKYITNKINSKINMNKNVKEIYNINDKYFGQFQCIKVNKKNK